jgi:uncharacterized protein YjaG (DUF416 family)
MPDEPTPVDSLLEPRTRGLRQLSLPKTAVIAAGCAERLRPAFELFRAETRWDEEGAFGRLIDHVWEQFAARQKPAPDLSGRLLALTPEGDEFDSDYTTAAQDACICLSSAIGLSAGDSRELHFLEYVIEAYMSLTSEMRSGKTLVSGSKEELEFQERFCRSRGLRRELEALDADLQLLRNAELTPASIDEIRTRARACGITPG